jgi:hypothetical protein
VFKVFNPFIDYNEEMRINGDHKAIGDWEASGPQCMELNKKRQNDMKTEKYGQKVKHYEFKSVFFNKSDHKKLRYNYSKTRFDGSVEWENEPVREMIISSPSEYQG